MKAYEETAQNTAKESQVTLNENESAQLAMRNAQAVSTVSLDCSEILTIFLGGRIHETVTGK
jgi:hypothetical protein